jgi:hypothetical protein
MKRRAALRKAEKAKAEATKAGFLPIPKSIMGSGWFHFVTTILGWAVLIKTKSLLFWLGQAAFSLFFYVS